MRPLLLVAALLLGACGHRTADGTEQSPLAVPPAPSGSAPATPVDHLAPGELVEGTQRAFGVALPRDSMVDEDQPGTVRASSRASVHSLVRYFRSRVLDSHLVEGDTFATFDHVKLAGKPGQVFSIDISNAPTGGSIVELDNVTPPPAPNLPDETARWRQVGLTPQGKVLDPTHLD